MSKQGLRKQERMAGLMALLAVILALGALTLQPPSITYAQNTTCMQILPEVQKRLTSCSKLGGDQVCYGNPAVTATFVDGRNSLYFSRPGDTVDLSALKTLETTPLNLERNEWGIAALKVQVANLDGTATGQVATFVLFGDTTLTNATPATSQPVTKATPPPVCSASTSRFGVLRNAPTNGSQSVKVLGAGTALTVSGRAADSKWLFIDDQGQTGWLAASSVNADCDLSAQPVIDPSVPAVMSGLRAFYFSTGVATQAHCQDVPQGGFMVRSPTGRKVDFTVDGVHISMGSTVEFLRVGNYLIIIVLDGEIKVSVGNYARTLITGQEIHILLSGDPPEATSDPLPLPTFARDAASAAVRCAVDPVLNSGCTQFPNNVNVIAFNGSEGDPILRPDGGAGVVDGPKPPPRGSSGGSALVCGACTIDPDCNVCPGNPICFIPFGQPTGFCVP